MGCIESKAPPAAPEPTPLGELDAQVFLMVNGTSGGQASKQLLEMDESEFEWTSKKGKQVKVWVFDLRSSDSRSAGFARVSEESKRVKSGAGKSDLRVVACGGDGTVKWVISELSKVDCLHLPIGVIPFGTGNDFSRAMGWGASAPSTLIGKKKAALKARMEVVIESKVGPLDTWLCDITVRDDGLFKEVKDGKITTTHEGQRTITHECINYLSCGADAQIVFEFEQSRTKSQIGNKWVYVKKGTNQVVNRPRKLKKMVTALEDEQGEAITFRKRDRVLAFLNIPSYSAGANIWRPGKGRYGTFTSQFVGDKRLEAVTVHTTTDVAVHIATGSHLGIFRVAQAGGYNINFKEGSHVYVQVDGEAIKAENLANITIRHGYQVNVLRSPKAKARSSPASKAPAKSATPEQPGGEVDDAGDVDDSIVATVASAAKITVIEEEGVQSDDEDESPDGADEEQVDEATPVAQVTFDEEDTEALTKAALIMQKKIRLRAKAAQPQAGPASE